MQLYNEAIDVSGRSRSGVPLTVEWRGSELRIQGVREVWQAPGDVRVYRVGAAMGGGGLGIAELAADHDGGWRLRYLWL